MIVSAGRTDAATRAMLAIAGLLVTLLGAAIALAGLMVRDGATFCLLSGAGLIVSGALVAKGHRAGAWVYMGVFAITVIWALRNIQLGGTSLPMRLVGPSLLLAMIALLMPVLRGWHPRTAAIAFTALMVGTIGLGISCLAGGPLARSTATVTQLLDNQTTGVPQ